jgi:transposase
MDIVTDTRLVSRLEVVDTGRRRRWSEAAKLRIVEESLSGPRRVSATARRHEISNQLLFAWRKAYREGRLGAVAGFVPATIAPEPGEAGDSRRGRIEIVSANGLRFVVDCAVDVEALARIMRGLEALP